MPKTTPHTYTIDELEKHACTLAGMLRKVQDGVLYLRKEGPPKLRVMHSQGYKKAKTGLQSWSDSVEKALQEIYDADIGPRHGAVDAISAEPEQSAKSGRRKPPKEA